MSTLKLLRNETNGVIYADPAKPDFTVRFRAVSAKKGLNGVSIMNHISEIVVSDNNSITIGTTTANDPLSVRLRASGTQASADRLEEILLAMIAQIPTWVNEGLLLGFSPDTAPVVPAV